MSAEKVLMKIHDAPNEEAAYEAQQMLKTIYHRLRSRGKLQDSYDLLRRGAAAQLKRKQAETDCIKAILLAFPRRPPHGEAAAEAETSFSEASRVGSTALRWARKQGDSGAARQFHDALGRLAVATLSGWRALAAAADHFTRGTDAGAFARLLHEQAGAEGGDDLLVTRAVLQVLAAARQQEQEQQQQQLQLANELLRAFIGLGPRAAEQPLIHFSHLVLRAVEARSLPLVELLEREYAVSLGRDPQLPVLLQAAKAAYFATSQQGVGGMLGSLFSMLSAEEGQPA